MKKNIFFGLLLVIVILVIFLVFFTVNISTIKKNEREVKAFNSQYEEYNKTEVNGLDVTTLINKAVSHNEKKYIQKDDKGFYEDDEDRIEIYVTFNGNDYRMERINKLGIESFIEYFGSVKFNCTDIQYHDSGYISSMTFEAVNY